jgi:hypothetical protein
MKNFSDVPPDLKQLVLSYMDASSCVSLSCTSREWNVLLRSLCQWSEKVHQHVNIRASKIWENMLLPLQRVQVQMHCWDVSWFARDVAVRFERDTMLYKNFNSWLRLQEERHAEINKIMLLESAWDKPVYSVAAHKQRMKLVSSFSARAFDASRARVAELDIAIAQTPIGWKWQRTPDEDTAKALEKINKLETTEMYLKWFLVNASCLYSDAFGRARTNASMITFFRRQLTFLKKIVEMCKRELLVLSDDN